MVHLAEQSKQATTKNLTKKFRLFIKTKSPRHKTYGLSIFTANAFTELLRTFDVNIFACLIKDVIILSPTNALAVILCSKI
jgi:hypothetical protein